MRQCRLELARRQVGPGGQATPQRLAPVAAAPGVERAALRTSPSDDFDDAYGDPGNHTECSGEGRRDARLRQSDNNGT
jgi:hypothetical protein